MKRPLFPNMHSPSAGRTTKLALLPALEKTIEAIFHTFELGWFGLPRQCDRYRPSREATKLTVIATITVPNTYEVRA